MCTSATPNRRRSAAPTLALALVLAAWAAAATAWDQPLWTRSLGSVGDPAWGEAPKVACDGERNIIVLSEHRGEDQITKLSPAGRRLWRRGLLPGRDATQLATRGDGVSFIAGGYRSASLQVWLARLDREGGVAWIRDSGVPIPFLDEYPHANRAVDLALDRDGGAYLAGVARGASFFDLSQDMNWFGRYTAAGARLWYRLEAFDQYQEILASGVQDIATDGAGGLTLVGVQFVTNDLNEIGWVRRHDRSGGFLGRRVLADRPTIDGLAMAVAVHAEGKIAVVRQLFPTYDDLGRTTLTIFRPDLTVSSRADVTLANQIWRDIAVAWQGERIVLMQARRFDDPRTVLRVFAADGQVVRRIDIEGHAQSLAIDAARDIVIGGVQPNGIATVAKYAGRE